MNGVNYPMSWTVIKMNDEGMVGYSNDYGPHDRSSAMKELRARHGSVELPVDGYHVIAILPGNHPVYT